MGDMINRVTKDIIRSFNVKKLINPAFHSIGTTEPEQFIKRLIDENTFGYGDVYAFSLDTDNDWHCYLRNEINEILRLNRSIIFINNFYTPGKPFNHSNRNGERLDINYIRDIIGERTDSIYYTAIADDGNNGMAILFIGYQENLLEDKLTGIALIKEKLSDGTLTMLGRSGRILLMGLGDHIVRTSIPTQFFENYIDKCIAGYEIITFGYNKGVDICIKPEDDISVVIQALTNGWLPDVCILPNCEFNLLPKGIEHVPFPTVYIAYDWDYYWHTAKTFVESVDFTFVFGEYAKKALSTLGANHIEIYYPHSVPKELFAFSPKKIKDRKYDICYTTFVDDVLHPDRSEWIITLCKLAEKYKIRIVPHTSFHSYLELLQDSKLTFSHQRLGEMSIRMYEACSQGTVTMDTGSEVKKYFIPDEEYIPVTKDIIEMQIKKYLEDNNLLQQMSDRDYKKALDNYEPRGLFKNMIYRLYELIDNYSPERKFNDLPESERLLRRGEIYYFSFCRGLRGASLINKYNEFLQMSIQEFRKSIALEPTPRGINNLSVAETLYNFRNYDGDVLDKEVKKVICYLIRLIEEYPSYAIAYFQIGLIYFRLGNYDDAFEYLQEALSAFRDPESTIDPWALYPADLEIDPKSAFILSKPINSALFTLTTGNISGSECSIRKLYEAATLYYLSVLDEKRGQIIQSLKSLSESYQNYPNSGLVAMHTAKRYGIFGNKENSLAMFRKGINLLPLDIDFRIEYIKHLYLYKQDKDMMSEIRNIMTIIKAMDAFKNKINLLKDVADSFNRFNTSTSVYSHDSCKEILLNNWIEILYRHLRNNKKDFKLIIRIIQIWQELGRVEKIFELLEDFIPAYAKEINKDSTLARNTQEIFDCLETTIELSNKIYKEKMGRLKEFNLIQVSN